MTIVRTKAELEQAVERKDREIIIEGALAEKLKPIAKLKNISKAKFLVLGGIVPMVIASMMILTKGGTVSITAIEKFITSNNIKELTGEELIALVAVVGVLGLLYLAVVKNYDVELEYDKEGKLRIKLVRKNNN